jgi:heterodisulfide reductase subunit C
MKEEITIEDLDLNFKEEIAKEPGGEKIAYCFSCGACTAGCPVRWVDASYNPRKIIRMVLLGMKKEVFKSKFIWLCSTCYSCQERCPQDVRITDLMNAIKNVATKSGYAHPSYIQTAELINDSGRLYALEDFDNKKREKIELPSLPTKIDEVAKLIKMCLAGKLMEEKKEKETEEDKDKKES